MREINGSSGCSVPQDSTNAHTAGCRSLLILLLIAIPAGAETKTEKELRMRLASEEAARAKDRASFAAAVAKLSNEGSQRAADASDTADSLKAVAKENADVAKAAADKAKEAADQAKAQADALQRASDRGNFAIVVTQVFGFGGLVVMGAMGFAYRAFSEKRAHDWAKEKEDAAEQHRLEVLDKIGEVKQEAHKAYEIGNNISEKIATVGLHLGTAPRSPTAEAPDAVRVSPTEKGSEPIEEHAG